MEYSFWKLKTNLVRIVKYRFGSININSILFRPSSVEVIYYILGSYPDSQKNIDSTLD